MFKVLIADSGDVIGKYLGRLLEKEYSVYVRTDEPLEELVCRWKPDVLVLDLHLRGYNGWQMLAKLMSLPHCPMIVAMSLYVDSSSARYADAHDVDFLLCKPCPLPNVANHIHDLLQYENLQKQYPRYNEHDIARHLKRLGLPAHLDGSKYLCEALRQLADKPDQRYTKELYPAVGAVFGVSGERVERCIRDAIRKAWLKRDEQIWKRYFQPDGLGNIARPSNAQFISCLMNELRFAA